MRHQFLLQAAMVAMVLGSTQLQAGEDYPAADFEPQVIYQDSELIESVGPLLNQTTTSSEAATTYQTRGGDLSGHVKPAGSVTDSTPPYGMLLLALVIIGLPFWLSMREEKEGPQKDSDSESAEADEAVSEGAEDSQEPEEGEEALEVLAEEVEATMASSNRQRANKSKRARRR